jgi:hypothetical protein
VTDPTGDRGLAGFAVFVVLLTLAACSVLGTVGLAWFSHQGP